MKKGQAGGKANFKKHGRKHMVEIGRKGAAAMWEKYKLVPVGTSEYQLVERNLEKKHMAKVEIRVKQIKDGPWLKKLFATLNFFNGKLGTVEEQADGYCQEVADNTGYQVRWNLKGSKRGKIIDPQS